MSGTGKRTFSDRQRQRRGSYVVPDVLEEEVSPDIRRPFVGAKDDNEFTTANSGQADSLPGSSRTGQQHKQGQKWYDTNVRREGSTYSKQRKAKGFDGDDTRNNFIEGINGLVRKSKRVLKKLTCGAVAGAVSRTLTAPVETVKVMIMNSGAVTL